MEPTIVSKDEFLRRTYPEAYQQGFDDGFERGRNYGAGELIEWAVSVDLPKRRCRESKPHFSHTWVEGETIETHLGWQCPGKVGV